MARLVSPSELHDRNVCIGPDKVNTVEVPCDPRDPDYQRWFPPNSWAVRSGNEVTALVGGQEAFAMMGKAIATATANDHYIYMLAWSIDLDVNLAPGWTLWGYLSAAVAAGVQVRGMFWAQPGGQNTSETKRVNKLQNASVPDANGAAIRDGNTLPLKGARVNLGSHHQKILVVNGHSGLIAFCGGIDFNADRVASVARQPGSPMHDVHCRIIGPSAFDLLKIFIERWNDHPDTVSLDKKKGPLRAQALPDPIPTGPGEQYVQIVRTYGNGTAHPGQRLPPPAADRFSGITNRRGQHWYDFAPLGETSCQKLVFHAIAQAKRFIYIEDQYLQSMEASNALLAALPNIQKLVILIPHPSINDHPNMWRFHKAFIDNFKGDPKVSICYPKEAGVAADPKRIARTSVGTYVHSKTWIIDDKLALIGSTNCNMRGYTHDSEVVAGIFDESKDKPCTLHFAHSLRIKLWALHLNLKPADVFDPIGSAAHWMHPTIDSRIGKFDQNADTDNPKLTKNRPPDSISEPDGR
jgi:phosphatidylserine/phosphatidylglycerophosphate/cardiolipin synthase-like enzyme